MMILGLIAAYLATRLVNLTLLPIFTDEAIYIRWGMIGVADAAHRFLSLEDGKQPLFIWLMYPMLKLFSDPLFAARMVSVFSGLFSLVGLMVLTKMTFGKKAIIPAAILYIISPFFLFYDRLALYDSLTTMFAIWALVLEIWLVKSLRLDAALILGFAIGGGLLTKSSAQFSLYLLPASLVLFDWHKTHLKSRLLQWLGLAALASLIALAFSWIIKLSPLQHMVGQKNLTFIYSFSEFFQNPFQHFQGNLKGLLNWLIGYLTWPWIIGFLLSLPLSFKKHFRATLLLLTWWLFPFLVLAAFGRVLYPRFILFMTFPLLLILAFGIIQIGKFLKNRLLLISGFLFLMAYAIYISSQLLFNPLNAPIPKADRLQFMDDWPSGYGIPEVIEFIRAESQKQPIFLATEGTFGLTPYALMIYLQGIPNLTIEGYWPIADFMDAIISQSKHQTTYVLFKDTQEPQPQWPLTLVLKYRKGRGDVFTTLYRVNP